MIRYFRRLAGLYGRYVLAHDRIAGRTGPLRNDTGQTVGAITSLDRDQSRLRIAGQVHASRVTLLWGDQSVEVERPSGLAADTALSFDMALPLERHAAPTGGHLRWQMPNGAQSTDLRFPGPTQVRLTHLGGFTVALIGLVPALWGWWRTHDPRYRGRVKRGLGLDKDARFQPLERHCLPIDGPTPNPDTPMTAVTIILPVYNGLDLLKECLARVEENTDLPWHLIIINDASPDPQIKPFLDGFAAQDRSDRHPAARVTFLSCDTNLGFIGAVNLGLERAGVQQGRAPDAPVVLLNTDALVPKGWASRLIAPMSGADADPTVASVTPMSNDSEITNVPVICAPNDLPHGTADRLDDVAQSLSPEHATVDMPTGVGFCMALSPQFLARVPRLDTVFGRGYGEEVDWCQKVRALGGRHLGLGTLFVEHKGGSSFGSAAKAKLIAQNGALISQRYPAYDLEVARFIADDPLSTPRLALALAWAGAKRKDLPIYLAHDMGGGADFWLNQHIAADLARDLPSVVLRVGGPMRWQLEVHAPSGNGAFSGVSGAATMDFDAIAWLLALLPARHLIYSCGVGDPDPFALPDLLLSLLSPSDTLDVLFHDWFPISPSYTLLDADGVYRGPVGANRKDTAHQARQPGGTLVTLPEWQAAWGRLMDRATTIRVFSEDGLAQLAAPWPALDQGKVLVQGHATQDLHRLRLADDVLSTLSTNPTVVGILGNLNLHKGSDVVTALAKHLRASKSQTRMVVLGQVDPAHPLPRHVPVHGAYQVDDIPDLVAKYGITHWLVPSIWPETFSYTTHEALATGLPVLAFDLGAQGAATARAGNGRTIALSPDTDPVQAILDALPH